MIHASKPSHTVNVLTGKGLLWSSLFKVEYVIHASKPSHNWNVLIGNGLLGSSLLQVKYVVHGKKPSHNWDTLIGKGLLRSSLFKVNARKLPMQGMFSQAMDWWGSHCSRSNMWSMGHWNGSCRAYFHRQKAAVELIVQGQRCDPWDTGMVGAGRIRGCSHRQWGCSHRQKHGGDLTVQDQKYDPWDTGMGVAGRSRGCCHHGGPTSGPCHTTALASPGCGSGCLL